MVAMTNQREKTATPSMAELLAQYAQQSRVLDDICDAFTRDMESYRRGNNYVSLFKYPDGTPILPPVMTYVKREEMKMWRQRAVLAETRIRNRNRSKTPTKGTIVDDTSGVYPGPRVSPEASGACASAATAGFGLCAGITPNDDQTRTGNGTQSQDINAYQLSPMETLEKKDDSPETFQKDFDETSASIDTSIIPTSQAITSAIVNELTQNLNDLSFKLASSTSSSVSNKTVIENVQEQSESVPRAATEEASSATPVNASVQDHSVPVEAANSSGQNQSGFSTEQTLNLLDEVDFDEEIALDLNKEGFLKEGLSRKIAFMSNQSSSDLESLLGEYQPLPSTKQELALDPNDPDEPEERSHLVVSAASSSGEQVAELHSFAPQRSTQSQASKCRLSVSEEFSHEFLSTYESSSVDLKQFMCASYVLESNSRGILLEDATDDCTTLFDEEYPGSDYDESSLPDLPMESFALDDDAQKSGDGSLIRTKSFVICRDQLIQRADVRVVPSSDADDFGDECLPEKPLSFVKSPQKQAFQRDRVQRHSPLRPRLQLPLNTVRQDEKLQRQEGKEADASESVDVASPGSPNDVPKPGSLKRRNSYDLLTPSPALLKAQVEKDRVFYEAAATAVVTPQPTLADRSPTTTAARPDSTPTMRKLVFQSQPDFTSDCLVPHSAMAAVVQDDQNERPVLLQPGFNGNGEERNLERESSFEHIQSNLISQQRERLAALLAKQVKEEKKLKQSQRSVVGRLFGDALRDDARKERTQSEPPFDRSTSDGSLNARSIAEVKANGPDAFLKLADGAVELLDFSSPETSQPKGSAQDLTWDEMADFGQFEENPSTLSLVGSPSEYSHHCRLSALVKGHLTRRLLAVASVRELRFSLAQLLKLKTMLETSSVADEDLARKTNEQIQSIRADIYDVFHFPAERRMSLIRSEAKGAKKRLTDNVPVAASDYVEVDVKNVKAKVEPTRNEAEVKSSAGKGLVKKRETPQGTPNGVRRALGFSCAMDKGNKPLKNVAPKTLTSPKAKPWK